MLNAILSARRRDRICALFFLTVLSSPQPANARAVARSTIEQAQAEAGKAAQAEYAIWKRADPSRATLPAASHTVIKSSSLKASTRTSLSRSSASTWR